MRRFVLLASLLMGCVELGVVTDGTSISVGKPSRGHLVEGTRLPDRGEGYFTREIWKNRNNRFGTDELIDLITGVSRRIAPKMEGMRLVVADLSQRGGGEARQWHRSHQSGRDVDLVYPILDKDGKAVEPDSMRVFTAGLVAKDESGMTVDVARVWIVVRELLTAPEAPVQWIFMYEPIAAQVIEYATQHKEPEALIARARKALKQPGDSAPHNDHMHVRIYCSAADRAYGCEDIGPMELLAEREAEGQFLATTRSPNEGEWGTPSPISFGSPEWGSPEWGSPEAGAPIAPEARPTWLSSSMLALASPPWAPPEYGSPPWVPSPAVASIAPPAPPELPDGAAAMSLPESFRPIEGVGASAELVTIQQFLRSGAYRVDLYRWR